MPDIGEGNVKPGIPGSPPHAETSLHPFASVVQTCTVGIYEDLFGAGQGRSRERNRRKLGWCGWEMVGLIPLLGLLSCVEPLDLGTRVPFDARACPIIPIEKAVQKSAARVRGV